MVQWWADYLDGNASEGITHYDFAKNKWADFSK
jgi:hypothetical protein